MITTLYRIIRNGFQNFWRQRVISIATFIVMLLALLAFEGLLISRFVGSTALATIQNKIDISVYFKTSAPEDKILDVKHALEQLSEVKSVEYISRQEALATFHETHRNDETVQKALEELNDNPFAAALNIKAQQPDQYQVIASYLENPSLRDYVLKVNYEQNKIVIDRLSAMISRARVAGAGLSVLLTVAAILVVFNTILLAIYSNKEEIGIMRLIGASNLYIRGPYIVEGILFGIVTSIFSMVIIAATVYFSAPYFDAFIPSMDLWGYFTGNFFSLFTSDILFGTMIGVVSSTIAIWKYLKI